MFDGPRHLPAIPLRWLALPTAVAIVVASVSLAAAASPSGDPAAATAVKPGESWIVYQVGDNDQDEVMLARPDGTGVHPLIPTRGPSRAHPDWSPDGTKIVYQHLESLSAIDAEIWVADADGSDAHNVYTCSPPGCNAWNFPSWSPDGSHIVFTNQASDPADPSVIVSSLVQSVDVASGTLQTLWTSPSPDLSYSRARYSPDGTKVAFTVKRWDVPAGATARPPDSDPIGSAIATLDLTDPIAEPKVLTDFELFADYPAWHPSGDKLVFDTGDPWSSNQGGPLDLYTIAADGTGMTQITRHADLGGGAAQAIWTPDGTRIMFTLESDTQSIVSVAADGTDLQHHVLPGEFPRLRPTP